MKRNPRFDLVGVERPPHDLAHLGEERLRPLNRPADDLRKESRKEEEHNRVALNRLVVPINFDQIGDQFERVIGDAERQQEAAPGARRLERHDHGDHRGDAGGHIRLLRPFAAALGYRDAQGVDHGRGDDEQQQIEPARKRVKRVRQRQKINRPPPAGKPIKDRRCGNKADIEQRRGEAHLRRLPLDQFEQFADVFEVANVLDAELDAERFLHRNDHIDVG